MADDIPLLRAPRRDQRVHGLSGLKVSPNANYEQISRLFVQAANQAEAPLNANFDGKTQAGVERFDNNCDGLAV